MKHYCIILAEDCHLLQLLIAAAVMSLIVAGCTAIGIDSPRKRAAMDFGQPLTVHMCIYLDDGVSRDDANYLLSSWNSEAEKYRLSVQAVSYFPLRRGAFLHSGIIEQIAAIPLPPGCERSIYFVNRNAGDLAWGLAELAGIPLPEVLGETDDATLTHAFVFAKTATAGQVFLTPYDVTRHELYHLVGCKQHFNMEKCYAEIQALKRREQSMIGAGQSAFYPTWDNLSDQMLTSRLAVEQRLSSAAEATGQ